MKKLTVRMHVSRAATTGAMRSRFSDWRKRYPRSVVLGATLGIIVLALVVPVAVYRSIAATSVVSFEAEQGSRSARAVAGSDPAASAGSYVQFSASTTTVPLPNPGVITNVTGGLEMTDTWIRVYAKPNSSEVFAHSGKNFQSRPLYVNTDGTANWRPTGGSVSGLVQHIVFDPVTPSTFWVSLMYGGDNTFYKSTNSGQTITPIGSLSHNDYVSVDFTDPARQTILVGGHEQKKTVYKSSNGGANFTNIGGSIPGANVSFSSHPLAINTQTYVVDGEASWTDGDLGIYRTTNGGTSWTRVSSEPVSWAPSLISNGTIFFRGDYGWAQFSSYLMRSTDNGATWTKINGSFNMAPIELPDGRLVSMQGNPSRLTVSTDNGSTWTPFGAVLPCTPDNIVYSSGQQAFYFHVWNTFCNGDSSIYRLK